MRFLLAILCWALSPFGMSAAVAQTLPVSEAEQAAMKDDEEYRDAYMTALMADPDRYIAYHLYLFDRDCKGAVDPAKRDPEMPEGFEKHLCVSYLGAAMQAALSRRDFEASLKYHSDMMAYQAAQGMPWCGQEMRIDFLRAYTLLEMNRPEEVEQYAAALGQSRLSDCTFGHMFELYRVYIPYLIRAGQFGKAKEYVDLMETAARAVDPLSGFGEEQSALFEIKEWDVLISTGLGRWIEARRLASAKIVSIERGDDLLTGRYLGLVYTRYSTVYRSLVAANWMLANGN